MRVGGIFCLYTMEITIEGKRYQLVPITEETEIPTEKQKYQKALKKARIYKSKYSDYTNISEGDLVSRILEIDELSDEDYVIRQFSIWFDWDRCYEALTCCEHNPYKNAEHLKEQVLKNVRDVYRNETSIETGFFRIVYSPEEFVDGEHYPAQIKVSCIIESIEEDLGQNDRDYLLPTDEQDD